MPSPLRALEDRLDRLLARGEVGREAALVADAGREAALVQDAAQRVEGLGADPELALRAMTRRFVERVERAERFAAEEGKVFSELDLGEQDRYFDRAKVAFE